MYKVLIAGYGSAGQYLVDFLLKDRRIPEDKFEIYIMSRKSLTDVQPRLEISQIAAGLSDRFVKIKYTKCDFNDIDAMTDIIKDIKPTIIVYTGRYVSGIKYGALSYPYGIGYGAWIPLAFPYINNLMKAVKESKVDCITINTSFPDGVNCLLDKLGRSPTLGAGNINHLIPRIRRSVSKMFYVEPKDVGVDLVCSHYTNTYVSKEGDLRGSDIALVTWNKSNGDVLYSSLSDDVSIRDEIIKGCKDISAGGPVRNQMIATDCAELVYKIISSKEDSSFVASQHVPGFLGNPGGQRVLFREGMVINGSEFDEELIKSVNEKGLYLDGVVIKDNGIEFTEDLRKKMMEVYRIQYPYFLPADRVQEFAEFIYKVLKEYGKVS